MALIPLSIWRYSSVDETRKADVAIVMGAAVYDDRPSPVFLERIRHAIKLYQDGTVDRLVFTGARDQYDSVSEAAAAKAVAVAAGVDEADILMEEKSIQTWGNLANCVPILEEEGIQSVLLVSDPLHMKRSMAMAEDLKIKAYASPTPTSRYQSREAKLQFLKSETIYYVIYKVRNLLGYEDHK
jgi:uncharacterized SAM-binding protein YcdF (DUF218 family)